MFGAKFLLNQIWTVMELGFPRYGTRRKLTKKKYCAGK